MIVDKIGVRVRARGVTIACLIALLMALLAGCGTGSATSHKGATSTTSATSATSATADDPLSINRGAAQTVSGLQVRIESPAAGVPSEPDPRLGLDCGNHLVLTQTPSVNTSAVQVEASEDYLTHAPLGPWGLPLTGSKTPPALRWAIGARPYTEVDGTVDPAECDAVLLISNASNRTIVVTGGGVHIDSGPLASTFHYNGLETCGFQIARYYDLCYPASGQVGSCGYTVDVTIVATAEAGDRLPSDITSIIGNDNAVCPTPMAISPGASVQLTVSLSAASATATGVYRVTPYLLTDQGILDYPDLSSHVVFAADKDFSCYTYNGKALVSVNQDSDVELHPSKVVPPFLNYYNPICL